MNERLETVIEFSDVGVQFDDFIVHKNISFNVQAGEAITLIGPSAAGKTVILKLIMALLFPTQGQVRIFGSDTKRLDEEQLQEMRRNLGMLFQGAALFDSLSVYENIAYPLREAGETSENKIAKVVKERLEIIALPGIENKYPPELSGGQKKRVGLARALASSPRIILFDEPTTGLDPTAIRLIDELIIKLNREFGITCIAVTHDIESAKRISNRWILINKGHIVADGPVEEVSNENKSVIDFISGNWKAEMQV